jgi:uncharacterized protein YggT (Ycf19 family)
MSHQAHARRVGPVYRISRGLILFVYGFAIVCIVILAMAFFLQLFNANATAPFVDWVYRAAKRIMEPFRGIFPSVEGEQGSVFDVSMLFAMFMYGLLALAANGLVAWIDRKIAAIRYEQMWQPAATPPRSSEWQPAATPPTTSDVVTIPASAPAAPTAPEVTAPAVPSTVPEATAEAAPSTAPEVTAPPPAPPPSG